MELGALVCTPRNPQCPVCPLKKLCVAFRKDRVETLPNLSRRTPATARHFLAFVVERNGCFLVRQRPAGVVNAHLWEFPNIESNGADYEGAFNSIFGIRPPALESLCTVKHSITRYRITLEVWRAIFKRRSSAAPDIFGARRARPSENSEVWRTLAKMNSLAFTGAHRKILSRLTSNRRYT